MFLGLILFIDILCHKRDSSLTPPSTLLLPHPAINSLPELYCSNVHENVLAASLRGITEGVNNLSQPAFLTPAWQGIWFTRDALDRGVPFVPVFPEQSRFHGFERPLFRCRQNSVQDTKYAGFFKVIKIGRICECERKCWYFPRWEQTSIEVGQP